MISFLLRQFNRIPQPWRLIAFGVVCVAAIILVFVLVNQVSSCNYKRASSQYKAERDQWAKDREAWTTERAGLIANAEAKEKRIAELEPKAIAFDAVAQNNKRIDAGLASQITEVSKDAANAEANAELPTDCRTRAERVCALLRANNIKHDCAKLTRESCGAGATGQ